MKLRALAVAVLAALLPAGCGDDDEPERAATAPGTATTATGPAPSPPTTSTGTAPPGGAEHTGREDEGGDEEPVRIPATYTLRGGRLSPRTVSVPPFLAVEVSVTSRDRVVRVVTVRADRPYRLVVRPGRRAARLIPGQRPGRYPIVVRGGGRAVLSAGGEPGP